MPATSSPVRPQTELSFYDALRLVADGKKITRKEWNNEDCLFLHAGVLHIRNAAGLHRCIVGDGDILATDWTVVREQ